MPVPGSLVDTSHSHLGALFFDNFVGRDYFALLVLCAMSRRPDPPGERGADPPGRRAYEHSDLESLNDSDADDESNQSIPENDFEDDDLVGEEDEKINDMLVDEEKDGEDAMNEDDYDDDQHIEESHSQPTASLDESLGEDRDDILDFEPDCTKANAIGFYVLCKRLERLWEIRNRKTNRLSKDEVFTVLVDVSLMKHLASPSTWFPLMRLIVPEVDTSRPHTGMKERTIAMAWGEAFDLPQGSQPFQRLLNFTDPTHVAIGKRTHSDLSQAVQEVVEPRDGNEPSKLKLVHINDLLDELVAIKAGPIRGNHDWRTSTASNSKKKGPTVKQRRREWVKKLREKKLSALEHKWVVRILLQKMEIGFTSKTILNRWMPGGIALELYRMNNNLRSVCSTLSNPHWIQQREAKEKEKLQSEGKIIWMERTNGEAVLGNAITPMLALKVYFRDAMAELCRAHRTYAKKVFKDDPVRKNLLPLKNPAFICEVKLDGERMIVHVKRGIVTMHTRRGRWYSDLYSPVLAPAIRRALGKWDVDVIFDGEVIAWDNGRQEAIPFGNNRSVALARKQWMKVQGHLERRDQDLHKGQPDVNVMKPGSSETDGVENASGSDCWLRYEIFDILYVGGPHACKLLSMATYLPSDQVKPGSVIHLNGFQRKRILHHLVTPQEKEVVMVPTLVVRPNGTPESADQYFSVDDPTFQDNHQASVIDSIEWALDASSEDLVLYDNMRGRLSDVEIGIRRAEATDRFYCDIVDVRGLEGIILKDLNATYLLDGRKYWAKHKPDFEENAELNDIDLIILGAYHGTGMGPSGQLNAFLCGCIDDESPESYIAVCKVNGGSVSYDVREQMLNSTGYKKQTDNQSWELGQWFQESNHGKDVPDFISKRTFQSEDGRPPIFDKKKYPDLWIHPDDSIVLTVKASEIVATDGFQAGITLRFPRIDRVRLKNTGDDKAARHVETLEGLHRAYREQMQRREGSGEIQFQSGGSSFDKATRRFQTAEDGLKKKISNRGFGNRGPIWTMPTAERKESSALEGLTIAVLEGVYHLDDASLDAEEAKDQGWIDVAKSIVERDDILLFISKHGGSPKISISKDTDFAIGGRADDARVVMHHQGLEHALKQRLKSRSKVGLSIDDIIRIGGVLKWTWLISVVHQWKKEIMSLKVEQGQDLAAVLRNSSIKSTHPYMLKPTRHQYIIPTGSGYKDGDNVFGINITEKCTLIDFKRGLHEVANDDKLKVLKRVRLGLEAQAVLPWQYYTESILSKDMRWAMRGSMGRFWPFQQDGSFLNPVVVFPDIFDLDLGEIDGRVALESVRSGKEPTRWDKASQGTIMSCLPLVRAMGAQVTPHLHKDVTHILCESLPSDQLLFKDFLPREKRHRRIKIRLETMHSNECSVLLVTPDWIHGQWDSQTRNCVTSIGNTVA